MSVTTLYRLCIWLPIVVPALAVLTVRALGVPIADWLPVEILLYSLVYGGLPYAVLAAWATWWVGGRTEADVRRLMIRAPLLMIAVFATLAVAVGLAVGRPRAWIAVAVLGSAVILVLGYGYVGLTLLVRRAVRARA